MKFDFKAAIIEKEKNTDNTKITWYDLVMPMVILTDRKNNHFVK